MDPRRSTWAAPRVELGSSCSSAVVRGELDPREYAEIQVQAEARYRMADYAATAVALAPIAAGEATGDRALARFWLGKSLTMLGLHTSALAVFDRLLAPDRSDRSDRSDRFDRLTVAWLVALTRELPPGAEVRRRIGRYYDGRDPADLNDPAFDGLADELLALLGGYHLDRGDHAQAIALLRQVPKGSPDYGRARARLGIAFTLEYQGEPAFHAFKDALRHIARQYQAPVRYASRRRRRDGSIVPTLGEALQPLEDTVYLGMANIFYMVGKFDRAKYYLEEIAGDSQYYLQSLLWLAWADVRLAELDEDNAEQHYGRALGRLHQLNSPFFEEHLLPESYVLEAAVYAASCRYDSARRITQRFEHRYGGLAVALREVLEQAPADRALYRLAQQVEDHASHLDPHLEEVLLTLRAQPRVEGYFAYVRSIERELARLDDVLGSAVARSLRAQLTQALREALVGARERAGAALRDRIEQSIGEVGDARAELDRLRTAIESARVGRPEPVPARRPARPRIRREREIYRYTGEYWQDELDSYRYQGLDVCRP